MPKGYSPTIFVSSTCYDLSQVRVDLKQFIESLGYDPVMSEFNTFPVNPDHDTIGNCLENVKCRADILLLIVGGRYGFETDKGKSVTNLEYLEAKAKGIPVYVFVSKAILNVLPVWEENKDGNYSKVVDTPKLFEFVEGLRSKQENWVYAFETAQDITATLRTQLAYLVMDALEVRRKIKQLPLSGKLMELSPQSLQIVMQKPFGWEYRLFAQILKDGIDEQKYKKNDLRFGVAIGQVTKIEGLVEFGRWFGAQSSQLMNITNALTKLLNEGLVIAFGEPGVAGDPEMIMYIGRRIIECYKWMIDWSLQFKRLDIEEELEGLVNLASKMASNAINEIEEYSITLHNEANAALDNHMSYEDGTVLKFTLTLTVPDMTDFHNEISRLQSKYMS